MTNKELSILHVEADPGLTWIVRTVFEDLGFSGTTIISESVRDALDLLNERERKQQPLSLIATALKARMAAQFKALAVHILNHTQQVELRQKAVSLIKRSHLLEETIT